MKRITAYIQSHKLANVVHGLHGVEGLTGMSAYDVKGFGQAWREQDREKHVDEVELELLRNQVKVEIFCRDGLVATIVEMIVESARTGLSGDGKIYVSDVTDAVRIATGERGEDAI
ncbi:MAG: P-II family nitrogen regulator [Myxococcota bacterium]